MKIDLIADVFRRNTGVDQYRVGFRNHLVITAKKKDRPGINRMVAQVVGHAAAEITVPVAGAAQDIASGLIMFTFVRLIRRAHAVQKLVFQAGARACEAVERGDTKTSTYGVPL